MTDNPCPSCVKHQNKQSLDDVSADCFPCIWAHKKTGMWAHYEPVAGGEKILKELELVPLDTLTKPKDTVKSPNHYVLRDGLEVWDVRDALLEKMEGKITLKQADSWSRAWEYLTRAFLKNGKEDLMKTRQYLDRLIEETT